jgi:hypothetical protein
MKLGVLIIGLWCFATSAMAEIPNTIDVVSELSATSIHEIFLKLPVKGPIALEVVQHPDAAWIEIMALSEAASSERAVATSSETNVRIVIKDLSTRYRLIEGSDSVQREIVVAIEAIVSMGGERQMVVPTVQRSVLVCTRSDAKSAESMQHAATHGELPEAPSSVWDDVLEPVIFVTAAVATVVLLFTVRSK